MITRISYILNRRLCREITCKTDKDSSCCNECNFGLYFTACYKQTEAIRPFWNDAFDGNQYLCAYRNRRDGNERRLPTTELHCQQCDNRR